MQTNYVFSLVTLQSFLVRKNADIKRSDICGLKIFLWVAFACLFIVPTFQKKTKKNTMKKIRQVTGSHLSRSTPQTSSLPTHCEALQDGHRDTRSSQAKRTRGTRGTRPTCMACMARTARTTRRGTFARPRRHWDGVKHRLRPQKKALIEVQKLGISRCSWRLLLAVPRCVWMLLDNCIRLYKCIIQ